MAESRQSGFQFARRKPAIYRNSAIEFSAAPRTTGPGRKRSRHVTPPNDLFRRARSHQRCVRQMIFPVCKGDPSRLIITYACCHSVVGEQGKFEAAALAGENPPLFRSRYARLPAWRQIPRQRQGMHVFAWRLTRTEIGFLATYYADLLAMRSARKQACTNRTRLSMSTSETTCLNISSVLF